MEYYFSKLTSTEQKQYKKVIDAIENGKVSVKFAINITAEVVTKIISAVDYDHPELFYVDFKRVKYLSTPVGIIYCIDYTVMSSVRKEVINKMESRIKIVLEEIKIKEQDSDLDKCRKIHNYLINHIGYHYEALNNSEINSEAFNIRGVFEESKAVCEGISKAYKLLANKLGIKCLVANGVSSMDGFGERIPHAWNIVKIGNECAHIDVTWDLGLSASSRKNRYDYFLIPDEWITVDHEYFNLPKCKGFTYSYFAQKKCLFEEINSLKKFLEKDVKNSSKILYFKILGKNGLPDDIENRIYKLIKKEISNYIMSSYTMELVPNRRQNVFFVRINN